MVGGYKVTSGSKVNFYILDGRQYEQWGNGLRNVDALARREKSTSVRLRQELKPGTYYLLFAPDEAAAESLTVAAEFYLKYD